MKFRTILCDPPWAYNSAAVGWNGKHGAQHKYGTLSAEAICELPVASVAATDCALLLWTTWPLLREAFTVTDAWGFEYKTGLPWVKRSELGRRTRQGMGYHVRSESEVLLIATRGVCCPPPEKRRDGLILCPAGRHSAKPDEQYDFAEAYGGPYLEMFARPDGGLDVPRPGWTRIGNEITGRDIADDLRLLAETQK